MRGLLFVLGHLWTLPNTLLGLAVGLAALPFGARPYPGEGALAFRRVPRARGALVLGGVILHGGESLDLRVPTYAARLDTAARATRVRLGDHERAHVLQYLVLGPLFLPLYLCCGGISVRNPFERAADRYALTGRGWWPFLPSRPRLLSKPERGGNETTRHAHRSPERRVSAAGHATLPPFNSGTPMNAPAQEARSAVAGEHDSVRAVQWLGDRLRLLDQRRLPREVAWVDCHDAAEVARAIRDLVVRGAPAIGIAAAWGVVLAAQRGDDPATALAALRAARPTAVNLMWALDRMAACAGRGADAATLVREARAIGDEDLAANRAMGALGAALIEPGSGVLTHCNTGSLATSGYGTALGVIRAGHASGKVARVYVDETRPWLQGARLTMWELMQDGVPAILIADSAASHLMKSGVVQWVVVGADRIAANGDVANKIGTYQLAIAARYHGVRFMVVAPSTTVDPATPSGDAIDIELRDPGELFGPPDRRVVAEGAVAWNPVFDVTPHQLVDVLVTERGVIERPDAAALRAVFGTPAAR